MSIWRTNRSDQDPIVGPLFNPTTAQWEGYCISVLNSKGQPIPVTTSNPTRYLLIAGRPTILFDDRTEVVTPNRRALRSQNDTAFRVATLWRRNRDGQDYDSGEIFNYEALGYRKIGGWSLSTTSSFFIEEGHERDLKVARERLHNERKTCCCILVMVIPSVIATIAFFQSRINRLMPH